MPAAADHKVVIGELGALTVHIGETPVAVRGHRLRMVLAILALRHRRGASMDFLVDVVWPDDPPSARRSLANVIRRLRTLLGDTTILTEGTTYRLAERVQSDRGVFLRLVERATDVEASPHDVLEITARAAELWRADPWQGFDEDSPLIGDRVALRDARTRLLEAAAPAARAVGDDNRALGYLRELVNERPHHERWWRTLAEVTASTGDRVEGLRVLQAARSAIDQVGLVPSSDLVALEQRLVGAATVVADRRSPAPTATLRANPSLAVAEDVPFVGRAAEIDRLVDRRTNAPAALVSVIEGPAGAGKSRLMVEAARRCTDHVVLSGRCDESTWSTLGPIGQILDQVGASIHGEDCLDGFEDLLAPHLTGGRDTEPAPALSIEEQRERLVHACVSVLERASRRAQLLLLIDDVQWAPPIVVDVIEALTNRNTSSPVAVVVTHRVGRDDGALRDRLLRLNGGIATTHVNLGPLTVEDIASIIAEIDGDQDADVLLRRTGGNAFFVAELVRTDGGQADDQSLARLIRARVDLIHPRAGDFLTVAALCGVEFDPWLVADALSLEAATAGQLVDTLRGHQLVLVPESPRRLVAFAHGLVAEAMISTSGSHQKRRFHLRLAEIEKAGGAPVRTWIHHLIEAGSLVDSGLLVPSAIEACAQMLMRFQAEAAASLMERILELRLDVSERVRATTWLANSLMMIGDGSEWETLLLEAADLALRDGLDEDLAHVALSYSRGGPWVRNNDPNGPRLLGLALERCDDPTGNMKARLQARLASYSIFAGSLGQRVDAAGTAVSLARASGDHEALGDALNAAVVAVSCPAMLTQTRDFELEVRSLEDAGLARSEMRNRPEISTFWSGDGDRFRADVAVRRQQLEHATRRERQCLNGLETVLAVLEGRVDDARKQLALQELDTDVERGNHAWNTVVIEWLDGDVAAAFPVVRRAYDDFHGGPLRYTLLWAAGEAGDTDVVDELLDTITPHRVGRLAELMLGGFGLAGLAMTAALRADRALAALVEAELVPLSGQMIGVPWSAFPSVDFFLAVMAAANGDDRRAKRHRDRAAEVHERMGAPAFDRLIGRYVDL